MERLRLYAQSIPITLDSWIGAFVGILLVRILFEQFSSFRPQHFILIDLPTIIHYGVSFLAVVVVVMIILILFTKTSLQEVSAISIFGFMVILIPPIIDLIAGGVGGYQMSYIFVTWKELLTRFFTFFGGHINSGITLGIQIELALVIIFCYIYTYTATKNVVRAIGAAFSFYFIIFFLSSMPSFVALFLEPSNEPLTSVVRSLASSNIIQNNIHPDFSASSLGLVNLGFNKMMLGVGTIILTVSSFVLFFLEDKKKLTALIKNCRPERIIHMLLLFVFGSSLASGEWFNSWIDVQSYVLALLAFTWAAMFSICQNDIHDEKIDTISNPNRPLVTKELSKKDLETASKIFLGLAILSAYASSHYVLFFTCLFVVVYFIYSNPPLRLKRVPILSSFLISVACLSVLMAGFFLINPDKNIVAFPPRLVLAVLIFYTFISNFRDIKDVEGDRAMGVKTLPVLFGVKKAKKLIAGTGFILFLLIPLYLKSYFLVLPALATGLLSSYFITTEDYREWKVFLTYLIFFVLLIGTVFYR